MARYRHPRDVKQVWQPTQHHEQASSFLECTFAAGERGGAGRIDDDVIGCALLREILGGVIDDVMGTERAHQLHVGGAAHPGHVCPEVLGKLHCGGAYSSGRAIDEHFLPALQLSSSQEIQRRCSARGHCGGFIEGQIGRL